eukprot:961714-Rhodomonas_salina.2
MAARNGKFATTASGIGAESLLFVACARRRRGWDRSHRLHAHLAPVSALPFMSARASLPRIADTAGKEKNNTRGRATLWCASIESTGPCTLMNLQPYSCCLIRAPAS